MAYYTPLSQQEFPLKFARDRECWLFEAKRRYGLCVLNYVLTSNPIHLLVKDTNQHVIAKSLQSIAGRTAQEYNLRKQRKGISGGPLSCYRD